VIPRVFRSLSGRLGLKPEPQAKILQAGSFVIILPSNQSLFNRQQPGSETMKNLQDTVISAMNGPGDAAKLSASATKALKKAMLAKAMEAKKLAAEKKQTAKVIPMKRPASKSAKKTTAKATASIKKAAANKKVVRKTMKAGRKAKKKVR
jgi:hypothetical protein